jgi:hypothetical protein
LAGLDLISPSSQRGCCTFDGLLMLGYFAVRQFGRLECTAAINAKSCNTNRAGDAAGICIDYVLDSPRCKEDCFAQTRSSV